MSPWGTAGLLSCQRRYSGAKRAVFTLDRPEEDTAECRGSSQLLLTVEDYIGRASQGWVGEQVFARRNKDPATNDEGCFRPRIRLETENRRLHFVNLLLKVCKYEFVSAGFRCQLLLWSVYWSLSGFRHGCEIMGRTGSFCVPRRFSIFAIVAVAPYTVMLEEGVFSSAQTEIMQKNFYCWQKCSFQVPGSTIQWSHCKEETVSSHAIQRVCVSAS